jgi:membrane protease YdiL (CAAX protease family)
VAERVPVPDAPPPPVGWPGPQGAARPPVAPGSAAVDPGLGLAASAVAVLLLGQVVGGVVVAGLMAASGAAPGGVADLDRVAILVAAVAGQVVGFLGVLALLRSRGYDLRDVVGPYRPILPRLLAGLGLGAATFVGSSLLVALLVGLAGSDARPDQALLDEALAGGLRTLLAVVAAVVLAPVVEELVFRGLVHRALRVRLAPVVATLISSAAFAAVHVDVARSQPWALGGLLLVGIVLASAYERTGGLLVPVALHAGFNGATLAVVVVADRAGLMDLIARAT